MTLETADRMFETADPWALFAAWLAEARAAEPADAEAMCLATVDESGLPNVRVMLMKAFDEAGIVFYTNFESIKGRELLAHPKAALNFHWKSLHRQVRFRGSVAPVAAEEADAYFATRPRDSQLGAWASSQSRPLDSRAVFEKAIARYADRFEDGPVPRPPHWSGFRLKPLEIEFWSGRPFRLHDRRRFARAAPDAPFTSQRLYP